MPEGILFLPVAGPELNLDRKLPEEARLQGSHVMQYLSADHQLLITAVCSSPQSPCKPGWRS